MEIGTSEAEPIWTEFLRKLTRRGLRSLKLVVSDAHEGLKAAVTKVLSATWQRCREGLLKKFLTTDSMWQSLILRRILRRSAAKSAISWKGLHHRPRRLNGNEWAEPVPRASLQATCGFRRRIRRGPRRRGDYR